METYALHRILHAHSMFRWLILLTLVVAIILGFTGWLGKKDWSKERQPCRLIAYHFH